MNDSQAEMVWASQYLAGMLGYEMYDADRTAKSNPLMVGWAEVRKANLLRCARALSIEEDTMCTYRRLVS